MVLAHGFPDTSAVWDGVARRLAERFHVVRYDLRGFGGSEAPRDVDGYAVGWLVEDLAAVVEAVGGPVHLVGHDWGSTQGWVAVAERPDLFRSFVSISGPDLGHVGSWVRRNRWRPVKVAGVVRRSWYILGFLVPVAPELVWRVPAVRRMLHAGRRELVNGLGLYRANVGRRAGSARTSGKGATAGPKRVSVPVHQVELTADPYVVREHLEAAEPWVEQLTRSTVHAGHWAVRTHPEQVARHIEDAIDGRHGRRLVVVTGAGSGGGAVGRTLADGGAQVVGADVADRAAAQAFADDVSERYGVPEVVVANVGPHVGADWREAVDAKLWGVANVVRAFAPLMVERAAGGHFVVTARRDGTARHAHATTKTALRMLIRCLKGELRPHGITVSLIFPDGGTVTEDVVRAVNARRRGYP
ncbi:alpha/beta fold hydrolase [Saccharothrix hoggarensis]|uniref:Alpha/beta fold hydrolase n=1 Tax=Saccharothrix hoggarensis TaxID=913853 RepID=A0ABW3QW90_9PSEU